MKQYMYFVLLMLLRWSKDGRLVITATSENNIYVAFLLNFRFGHKWNVHFLLNSCLLHLRKSHRSTVVERQLLILHDCMTGTHRNHMCMVHVSVILHMCSGYMHLICCLLECTKSIYFDQNWMYFEVLWLNLIYWLLYTHRFREIFNLLLE